MHYHSDYNYGSQISIMHFVTSQLAITYTSGHSIFHQGLKFYLNFKINAHYIAIKLSKIPSNSISGHLFFNIFLGGIPPDLLALPCYLCSFELSLCDHARFRTPLQKSLFMGLSPILFLPYSYFIQNTLYSPFFIVLPFRIFMYGMFRGTRKASDVQGKVKISKVKQDKRKEKLNLI